MHLLHLAHSLQGLLTKSVTICHTHQLPFIVGYLQYNESGAIRHAIECLDSPRPLFVVSMTACLTSIPHRWWFHLLSLSSGMEGY
jgi:hypothetical protein